jgi:hypothetical protein
VGSERRRDGYGYAIGRAFSSLQAVCPLSVSIVAPLLLLIDLKMPVKAVPFIFLSRNTVNDSLKNDVQ